jgi:hypothetical protein
LFKRLESVWARGAFVAAGFVVWGVLLFFLTFWIMQFVFSESL